MCNSQQPFTKLAKHDLQTAIPVKIKQQQQSEPGNLQDQQGSPVCVMWNCQGKGTYSIQGLAVQLLPVVQLQVIALILHHLRDVLPPEDPEPSDGKLPL